MKTSQKQTSRNGEDTSMCSQEDFHVSRSALQEKERERKTTVISGQKCYEQYGKYSPLGSLVKMLLVSSRWFSPARRLKWDVQTICSKRISYTERSSNSQSMPSVKTLNVQDIQSNRLLFRLVPSERPTGETGCGLLQDLMPTPIASDAQGGVVKLTKGRSARNGKVFSATLKDLAASKMLPTPQTQGLKVCNKDGKTEFLNLDLLLTPSASDGLRAGMSMESLKSHKKKYAEQSNLAEQIAHKTGGGTSQLNPLFVAEMMGYPLEWLTLPFLSLHGGAKVSKR
nr:MAG TPA: hypothetical protein [Caudoviricetes sp.]